MQLIASSCLLREPESRKSMGENDARTLLLEAIEGSLQQPVGGTQQPSELPGELQQNVGARATWWNHVRDRFFMSDETRMLRELRIDRNTFKDLVNVVANIHLLDAVDALSSSRTENASCFSTRFSHLDFTSRTCSSSRESSPRRKSMRSPSGSPRSTQTGCIQFSSRGGTA